MDTPEHPRLTPEAAARLIKQHGESDLFTEAEIASGLRQHVEEYGPAEIDAGGETYTVEIPDADPYIPDLNSWAEKLADEVRRTPTNYQGHPDVPEDAAVALVDALGPDDLRRLTDALLEAAPGFAERVTDLVLDDLADELQDHEETVGLIEQAREKWRNDA